jgi:REP element-mobilizing transposase RayT
MSVGLQIKDKHGFFFITFTCQNWLPLFQLTKGYDLIYKWFDYLKTKNHYINGYVIMPNHLHVLLALKNSEKPINIIVSNGKRFIAYEILKRLTDCDERILLEKLSDAVTTSDRKRGKLHQVFQPSFDCKNCYSENFIEQKLQYIHENPCKGKWNLADIAIEYKHSSAKYYATGEHAEYVVTNYKELYDLDLSR